ncbi:hypothetical protein Misp03_23370 [Microbispora sp. NBRC 16548]|nr:hypothetical protein Misp03_23370 [Microbispora sp. NBRC 16548]
MRDRVKRSGEHSRTGRQPQSDPAFIEPLLSKTPPGRTAGAAPHAHDGGDPLPVPMYRQGERAEPRKTAIGDSHHPHRRRREKVERKGRTTPAPPAAGSGRLSRYDIS